ncbi:hypothetical protein [Bacillus sp. AFS031507]|nr:hypothetical protein [Bacillus sp. AFS031507]
MRFGGIIRGIGGKGSEFGRIRTKIGGITPKVGGNPAQVRGISWPRVSC